MRLLNTLRALASCGLGLVITGCGGGGAGGGSIRTASPPALASGRAGHELHLTDETFDAWRDHIQLTAADAAWKKIPWLPTFHEGLAQARAEDRPLLLWVMNGHPLGCT